MPKRLIRIDDLNRIVSVSDPQISPDGDRVLFTKKVIGKKNNYASHLCTVSLDGQVTPWTSGDANESAGRWSPDGNWIAFVSDRAKPISQLFLISVLGGEAKQLSNLPEGKLEGYRWSPDGTKIAFAFREAIPNRTEAERKLQKETGLSDPPLEIDDIQYRLDGDGYFAGQRFKLYILNVATGTHELIYDQSPDGNYSYCWSPNSQELAVVHTANRNPFRELANDAIYRVNLDGQAWRIDGVPKGRKSNPAWSPDGKKIAYVGCNDQNDLWGSRNNHVYLVGAEGGEPRDLTGTTDYDAGVATLSDTGELGSGVELVWAPDGNGIYLPIGWQGQGQIGFAPIDGTGIILKTEGMHVLGLGNISKDGSKLAGVYGHPTRINEIAVIQPELGTGRLFPTVLTDLNHDFHAEVKLAEAEEFSVESTDGSMLHGWVLKPTEYLAPRRYPAILEIHGGPHTQYGWTFFHELQVLAAHGFAVVYTNPRGSKGYGEAHCHAISSNWGVKDWEDVQTATRWMQSQTYIHPGQMGVMGGSYGGYMTNWAIGHTDEFKAAITDRCVSNLVSMAGNSDFPLNKDDYFQGTPWGSLEKIRELWRQSPISYFENVKTPTLVIHSEGDLRCNVEQGEQVFNALQMQGIPSRFVRYPSSTSHGMSRSGPPDLRMHRLNEIVNWMKKWLVGEA